MKTYCGSRNAQGELTVTVEGTPLDPRLDLLNHSPTGFECGYGGSGPAQLALAILANALHDDAAILLHHDFKWQVVAKLPHHQWMLTSEEVRLAVEQLQQPERR